MPRPRPQGAPHLVAAFQDAGEMLEAMRRLGDAGCPVREVYTPFPVHELDQALGLRRSRLPWVTLAGALAGLGLALGFQFYANVFDWPVNVGNKPDNSTLAFLPVTFELTVLAGGVLTALVFFLRSGLLPGARPSVLGAGATADSFVVVVDAEHAARARPALAAAGASFPSGEPRP